MIVLSALLILGVIHSATDPAVGDNVRDAVCTMLNLDDEDCEEIAAPGETPGEPASPFELERLALPCIADRTHFHGEAMVLIPIPDSPVGARLEVAVGVVIDRVGTGVWRVTFHVDPGAGIGYMRGFEAGAGTGVGGFQDFSLTEGGRSSVSYDFSSSEEAWDFATDVRQWMRARPEAVQMAVEQAGSSLGSPGRLVAATVNAVVGVIVEAGNAVIDTILGTPAQPDVSITNAHVYLRGQGEAEYYAGSTGGVNAGVELEGESFLSEFHREGPAEGWTFYTFEASADGQLSLWGPLVGRSPGRAAPGIGVGGGVTYRARVIWDAEGKPVRFVLAEEISSGWQLGLAQGEGNSHRGANRDAITESYRDVVITEYNLDLRDEEQLRSAGVDPENLEERIEENRENLEAFNAAFWTIPGQFAYPRLPYDTDPLAEQMQTDAVEIGLEYRETTLDLAGLKFGGGTAALGGDLITVHRELQSATYLDHRWEDGIPGAFASCYSDADIFGPPAGDTGI